MMTKPPRKLGWRARLGLLTVFLAVTASGAVAQTTPEVLLRGEAGAQPARDASPSGETEQRRAEMVREQIAARGVEAAAVLAALRRIPRHEFVPSEQRHRAYADAPLPIGHGQTISQPFIVGYMTELLAIERGDRVLEVGTGSAYQAAVLAELAAEVVTIEIIRPLAQSAAKRLDALGYRNVTVLYGDGYFGWPERAPYDAIIVTAAASHVPPPLIEQLKPGGRMAIPVGNTWRQNLLLVEKDDEGRVSTQNRLPVTFVPLTGEH